MLNVTGATAAILQELVRFLGYSHYCNKQVPASDRATCTR